MSAKHSGCSSFPVRIVVFAICCSLLEILIASPDIEAQELSAKDHADMGIALAKQGKLPDAEKELRAAVARDPATAVYRAQLASVLGLQGKWNQAAENFQKAVELDPENLDFRRETAAVQWQLGAMSAAEENLQLVLRKRPGDGGATLLLGLVKERTGDFASAAQLLESQFDQVIVHPARTVALFHAAIESGQTTEVSKISDALKLRSADKQWTSAIGRCSQLAAMHRDLSTAETLFALLPNDAVRIEFSEDLISLLLDLHKTADAVALVDRALIAAPDDARPWLWKGNLALRANSYKDAIESYTHAEKLDHNNADAALGIAAVHFVAGQSDAAIAEYKSGIDRFPNDARFYVAYAEMLLTSPESLKFQAQAERLLKDAVRLDPESAEGHYQLGHLALQQGRPADAVEEFSKSLKSDPNRSKVHFALSSAYRRMGRGDQASKEFVIYQDLKRAEEGGSTPAASAGKEQ